MSISWMPLTLLQGSRAGFARPGCVEARCTDVISEGWFASWCCPPRWGTAGLCGSSSPPCLVLRASGRAGGAVWWGSSISTASSHPAGLTINMCDQGESRWRHQACRAPEGVPAAGAVTAAYQLACDSRGTCHQEVTGLVTPDRWPWAGAGSSAASVVLLRKLIDEESVCMYQRWCHNFWCHRQRWRLLPVLLRQCSWSKRQPVLVLPPLGNPLGQDGAGDSSSNAWDCLRHMLDEPRATRHRGARATAKPTCANPGSFVVQGAAGFWREECYHWHEGERRDPYWFRPLHPKPRGWEGRHLHHPLLLVFMASVFWDCFSKSREGSGELCTTTAQSSKQCLILSGSSPKMLQKLEIGEQENVEMGCYCRSGALCRDAEVQLLCSGADAPQQTSLMQHYVWGVYKPFFQKASPNMPLISSKASDGHTCRLVRTRQRVLPWLHLHLYSTKEGNRPRMKKKKQHFHLKAGRKDARQFVCGHKAAHLRQKGKLYQCNFPRQTSHNSERPFAVSRNELPFSCCGLHSFIAFPPSPLLLSLLITRPIHRHPLKCPVCRGGCSACFHFQLLDILSQGPSPR